MDAVRTLDSQRDSLTGPDPTWEILPERVRSRWLAEIQNFPTPPMILELIGGQLSLDSYDPQRVATMLSRDSVLTGRLIARANSAIYGLREPITTLSRALVQLGFTTVRSLITRYQMELTALLLPAPVRQNIMDIQRSADLGAAIAFHWSRAMKLPDPAGIATRCLLARLGTFLLARHFPELMVQYLSASSEPQRLQFEANHFGVTTRALTYRVAWVWGFPEVMQLELFHLWTPLFAEETDVARCIASASMSLGFDPPQQADDIQKWLSSRVHRRLRKNLEHCGALAALPNLLDNEAYRREMALLSEEEL